MRVISIAGQWIAAMALVASIGCVEATAGEAKRLPVPATTIYPGDMIRDELLTERMFAPNMPGASAFISDKSVVLGRVARRTLLPSQPIPINAVEDRKAVMRGNVVKVVIEDDGLSIVTYGSSLQSGSPGALIQLRNLDTGVIIRGVVQPDGTVRIQNG